MRRSILILLLCLAAGEVGAAEIHLRNGAVVSGKIRGENLSAIMVEPTIAGREVALTEGRISIRKSSIQLLILDEGDRFERTGKETFKVVSRDELVVDVPERPTGTDDTDIDLSGIDLDLPDQSDAAEGREGQTWRPRLPGPEIRVEELGVSLRLPGSFTHEVVTKGERPVLRVIAPEQDTSGLGINLWVQEKLHVPPFDTMERFYEHHQSTVLEILRRGDEPVEVMGLVHPRLLPKAGSAPRRARGTVYKVGTGETQRLIEVRIFRSFDKFFVFTFATSTELASAMNPIYEKCFASMRNLE